jgi:hypothetical protein
MAINRRARHALALVPLAIALVAGAGPALATGVQLDIRAQQHLGLVTAALPPASRADQIDAFAKVLDPAPLAQSASDLATAETASMASRAEAARAKALNNTGGGVSAKDAEAAIVQARSDALKVALLRRQIALQWGPGITRLPPVQFDRLVTALSSGRAALVHVDTHNNEGQAGARFVRIDIGDSSVRGRVLGPARAAEPRLQSSGLIVEVDGPSAILLSVGLTQSAHIESSKPRTGVILPRSAVVRLLGSLWAYVQTGPTMFERRLVHDPLPEADGFFVASGFSRGERVVVQGAAALFAAEQTATRADR